MQCRLTIRCAAILGLVGAQAAGAVRTGELEVRQGNAGVPCFTITEAEERRAGAPDFQSISVFDAATGAKTPMWSMAMSKVRTFPVSVRMCIPYAGRLPVLPQTPAAALMAGRPYEVTIEARAPQAAGAPRSYRGRFCLVGQEQGPPRVRNLDPKARAACTP